MPEVVRSAFGSIESVKNVRVVEVGFQYNTHLILGVAQTSPPSRSFAHLPSSLAHDRDFL